MPSNGPVAKAPQIIRFDNLSPGVSDQQELAFATFLLKILAPGFAVRDRPERNSPRKSKKAGDFPARKPGEPSVVNVTRYIQFHLLEPWMIT
jgi:hypothetical protein